MRRAFQLAVVVALVATACGDGGIGGSTDSRSALEVKGVFESAPLREPASRVGLWQGIGQKGRREDLRVGLMRTYPDLP